ncbi:MAG: type I-U CRISPR-associated protein Cas5/Cas6 [Deltaproteobacteria bacterium]|nr:type I-U CRISPR-associated protein Cas5/Cas6 [Deltaproteobacteria bacterium]
MNESLVVTIRFLDALFHGRKDRGDPEWPPSPLRLFQAMVASTAQGRRIPEQAQSAFVWLERLTEMSPPLIIAPPRVHPQPPGYCLSVPNNAMDIVARAWCNGNYSNSGDANPATHRTMKTVRPTHMLNCDSVHYLWRLPEKVTTAERSNVEYLVAAARTITCVGWGLDLVVGNGVLLDDGQCELLAGERWVPGFRGRAEGLRVPIAGTLTDLVTRYHGFLNRIGKDGFTPPPLVTAYDKVVYHQGNQRVRLPIAAFTLLKPDVVGFQAFDTTRWALTVSGMTRHAAKRAAQASRWPEARINAVIMGHGETVGAEKHFSVGSSRFAYIPLPSIEARGEGKAMVVGPVRRVLVTSFDTALYKEVAWTRQALSGQELFKESREKKADEAKKSVAMLSLVPSSEKGVRPYLSSAVSWATVTPVILPGFDDPAHFRRRLKSMTDAEEQKRLLRHLSERIDGLIRKAIVQAGFPQMLADNAIVEWRKIGYWRGTEHTDKYGVPNHLKKFPRYHVKLCWRDENQNPLSVHGPVCIGGGRFYGLGLFAPQD